MKLVGISGSPRRGAVSAILLNIVRQLSGADFTLYESLLDLPHFSPDKDGDSVDSTVRELRNLVRSSDGIVICTPEYAFSMPSVLKNALEWLVSSGELNEKPCLTISTSPLPPGGDKAHKELRSVLTALGVKQATDNLLCIGATRKRISNSGELLDPSIEAELRSGVLALTNLITIPTNV
ncbi:MAG TPA: NADPH-dependent FMN reductase [Candidatus Kapabacteria bacterium]|nr:NADPH-dependent FMN reductase [Candidatus Kapabacteria bacterium]